MFPIAQYWHQQDCPPAIRARQELWRDTWPDHHILYSRQTAESFLSTHFDGDAASGFRACAVPAMASDYFRYHWLAAVGGLYVDSAFFPGIVTGVTSLEAYPIFALSVPQEDTTEAIVAARKVLGSVLLNGVLFSRKAPCSYFGMVSALVRRLVHDRASNQIPLVTGIGVLSAFNYAVSVSDSGPRTTIETLQKALPFGSDRMLAIFREFLTENSVSLRALPICSSKSSVEMAEAFRRPVEDHTRLVDAAHWSNHRGSIFVET